MRVTITTILVSLLSLTYAEKKSEDYKPEAGSTVEKNVVGIWKTEDTEKPNVLILGDSISIGYTPGVKKLLAETADVFRPYTTSGEKSINCQGTTNSLPNLEAWLEMNSQWDVIHFNWGLHDLKKVQEAGSSKNSANPDDPYQATIETIPLSYVPLFYRL